MARGKKGGEDLTRCSCCGECKSDKESCQLLKIDGASRAGGRDWGSWAGKMLCQACYNRFKKKGTLEGAQKQQQQQQQKQPHDQEFDEEEVKLERGSERRAPKPRPAAEFRSNGDVEGGIVKMDDSDAQAGSGARARAGARAGVEGDVGQYRGPERPPPQPRAVAGADGDGGGGGGGAGGGGFERRCTYEGCENPEKSSGFLKISNNTRAGGQDWSSLLGRVLCVACYSRYQDKGTLERSSRKHTPENFVRRCTYEFCDRPEQSRRFHRINGDNRAGGRDWGQMDGKVLCQACYGRFRDKGTLDKLSGKQRGNFKKICTYEECDSPEESNQFYKIDGSTKAGGQDWSSLDGRVLCNACYTQYRLKGMLERASGSISKRKRTSSPEEAP